MSYRNDETYTPPWIATMLAMVLGALFLVAGTAKVAEFAPFSQTVGTIAGLAPVATTAASASVILAEIAAGAALMCRRRVTLAALLLSGMTLVFIAVLLASILMETPIACHCFGLLGSLPNHIELVLDVVLLDLLLLLVWLNRRRSWPAYGVAGLMCTACLLLALEFTTVQTAFSHVRNRPEISLATPLAVADSAVPEFHARTGNRVLLLLRFADFSCALCFDDFMLLSDSLGATLPSMRGGVAALIQIDSTALFRSPTRLKQWVRQSGISYPFIPVADTLFASAGIQKSLVAVVGRDSRILLLEEFPLGAEKQSRVLRLFSPLPME